MNASASHGNAVAAPPAAAEARPRVLVVDDTPVNLSLLANLLKPHYRVQLAHSGAKALELVRRQPPDVVVLDVMMPELDGYEVCRRLKADPATRGVPVLFLTALSRAEDETEGFAAGGADFIHKPFNPATVLARVATQVQVKAWQDALRDRNAWLEQALAARRRELEHLREATLQVMVSFAEHRDEGGGQHVLRSQEYVRTLAFWLIRHAPQAWAGLDEVQIEVIARSAPLHDVGKVTIPDGILLKAGPLSAEETAIMKTHALRGSELLERAAQRMGPDAAPHLVYAQQIARHHHEHWDGSGYPDGLAGEAIPPAARLMAVADVYDALISRRPYKPPMPHDQALARIEAGAGAQFDPAVVSALRASHARFIEIAERWRDQPCHLTMPGPEPLPQA